MARPPKYRKQVSKSLENLSQFTNIPHPNFGATNVRQKRYGSQLGNYQTAEKTNMLTMAPYQTQFYRKQVSNSTIIGNMDYLRGRKLNNSSIIETGSQNVNDSFTNGAHNQHYSPYGSSTKSILNQNRIAHMTR